MLNNIIQKKKTKKGPSLEKEADYFSKTNNHEVREVSWSAVKYFQQQMTKEFNFRKYLNDNNISLEGAHALTMGCGDMDGEYRLFKNHKVGKIDAFDISEGQRKKFFDRVYDDSIEIDYQIVDCNKLKLEENKYDFIFIQQSYHHLENVSGVAKELNKALKPDGIFLLIDYIGTPFLQRSEKQRAFARTIWKHIPKRLRKHPSGKYMDYIYIPDKNHLSPYEAICSDKILNAVKKNFIIEESFYYGGIIFPLFQGFSQNYKEEEIDQFIIKSMWDLDQELIKSNAVEPNYIRAILKKKPKAKRKPRKKTK